MKRIYKMFMAVAAVAGVTACTTDVTEDLGVNLNGGPTTLTLSLDDTRTQLGERADGVYPLTWAENDAISVNGSVSNALAEDEAGATTATFTFNNGFGENPKSYFIAYPAVDGVANQVMFAAEQTHTSNTTFGNGAAVMYGYTTDLNNVTLNHLTGVLKIGIVSGTEELTFIKEVRISTVDRKPIAGAFNATYNAETEKMELTPAEGATEVITYKAASDAGFPVPVGTATSENPAYIHVAVPAGVYGELYVTLESADGVMYKTVTTDSTKPVNAGTVREFTSNVVFEPTDETETYVIANYYDLLDFQLAINNAQATMDNAEATEDAKTAAAATLAKSAVLVNDIEIPTAVQPGYEWAPINAPSYTGTITGNGYAIKNLTTPLFVQTAASFKGLHLDVVVEEKVNPNFGAFARKLIATTNAPTVENCSVSGTITINTDVAPETTDVYADGATGGFVGIASGVHFEDCVNNATLELKQYSSTVEMYGIMGGIVGLTGTANSLFTSFTNCSNNGNLTFSDATDKLVVAFGGIIGIYEGKKAVTTIDNCSNNGNFKVTSTAASRDCYIGGIVGGIFGINDGSDSSNLKTINFTNTTINNGNILVEAEVTNAKLGGIAGFFNLYNTVYLIGTTTNNGTITVNKKATNIRAGGILGYQNGRCSLYINNFTTNSSTATINVSATITETCYCGGIIGFSYHTGTSGGDSNRPFLRVQNKTVTNNAAITFSGVCTKDLRIGGFIAYSHNGTTYFNKNGKFVNNGTITVDENAELKSVMHIGGAVGMVNGYNMTAGSQNQGQIVNNGDIYFKGKASSTIGIGGIFGRQWNNTTSLELINTGNIYAIGSYVTGKTVRVGGIIGIIDSGKNIQKAQCYCNIEAYNVSEDTINSYPQVGIIVGSPEATLGTASNVKLGGKIATTATVTNGVVTPTWVELNATNYFDYVSGTRTNLTEYAGATLLNSKDEIVYGNFGNS